MPLRFGEGGQVPFTIPGMSDVMPYPSTRFQDLADAQWQGYVQAWRDHVEAAVQRHTPDVIHSNHVWALSSIVKEVAPKIPQVVHCHATGLRQLELCPSRADEICRGVRRADRFVVLHGGHAESLQRQVGIDAGRIELVGAGYRDSVFHPGGTLARGATIAYVGKLSRAKGVAELCEAMQRVRERVPGVHLHVAGSGGGDEGEALRQRLASLGDAVTLHGHVTPETLAGILHGCSVCVLPSFYEGLPLVLVEAAASGCRLVSTALPGVVDQLASDLGPALRLVDLPEMDGPDTPVPASLPPFVDRLTDALLASLEDGATTLDAGALRVFTWSAVFERIERVWRSVLS